jgi:hypothetical protein
VDIARGVRIYTRSQTLSCGELALEQLASATNGTSGVAFDEIDRGARGPLVTLARTDLFLK